MKTSADLELGFSSSQSAEYRVSHAERVADSRCPIVLQLSKWRVPARASQPSQVDWVIPVA